MGILLSVGLGRAGSDVSAGPRVSAPPPGDRVSARSPFASPAIDEAIEKHYLLREYKPARLAAPSFETPPSPATLKCDRHRRARHNRPDGSLSALQGVAQISPLPPTARSPCHRRRPRSCSASTPSSSFARARANTRCTAKSCTPLSA